MSPSEIKSEFFVIWLSYRAGAIEIADFYRQINKLVESNRVADWLLEMSWLPENDLLAPIDYVEKLELFSDAEEILLGIFKTYRNGCCNSKHLVDLLEIYFLNEEYGGFYSPNKSLNDIYERYLAPKLELSKKELEIEISGFVAKNI